MAIPCSPAPDPVRTLLNRAGMICRQMSLGYEDADPARIALLNAAREIEALEVPARVTEEAPWIDAYNERPNCDDIAYVLAWFPGMKQPRIASSKEVGHWVLDADPIPGVVWMLLPQTPMNNGSQS